MPEALLEAEVESHGEMEQHAHPTDAPETALADEESIATVDAIAPDGVGVSVSDVEDAIENKRIGERIKYLRQRKQMGLVELGRHTGLSASFLSQLETGRVVPTLRNLARIAMVFSKDMSFFFEPEKPELFRIVRAEDRHRQPQTGVADPGYFFESLGHVPGFARGESSKRITPYIAEFLPATETRQPRSHRHAGMEFLYVLGGSLKLIHDGKEDTFDKGDALYFDASITHSYECAGEGACKALIVTMPEALRGNHTGSHVPMKPKPKK